MTVPTFLVILDFSTSSADRAAAVAQLTRDQPTVRAVPGCVDFRVFPSPESDTGVTVIQEWADQASFDRHLASDAFARSGEILRPLMDGPASSRRFQARLIETAG